MNIFSNVDLKTHDTSHDTSIEIRLFCDFPAQSLSSESLCLLLCIKVSAFFFFLITYIPINKFQVNCFGATWFVQQDPKYTPSWTSWALWIKLSLVGCDGLWRVVTDEITAPQLPTVDQPLNATWWHYLWFLAKQVNFSVRESLSCS